MEVLLTLISVTVGAITTGIAGVLLAKYNSRNKKLEELQNYRKSLIQEYLTCIDEYNQILHKFQREGLNFVIEHKKNQSSDILKVSDILAFDAEIRIVVIRASSVLKASGDIKLAMIGWIIYQEALNNVDPTNYTFKYEEYNPIHYFRVALDFGLTTFAHVISNCVPPSREMPDVEHSEHLTQQFKELIREKYKKNPDWFKQSETQFSNLVSMISPEIENDSQKNK